LLKNPGMIYIIDEIKVKYSSLVAHLKYRSTGKSHSPGTMYKVHQQMIRRSGKLGRIRNKSGKVSFKMVTEMNYAI